MPSTIFLTHSMPFQPADPANPMPQAEDLAKMPVPVWLTQLPEIQRRAEYHTSAAAPTDLGSPIRKSPVPQSVTKPSTPITSAAQPTSPAPAIEEAQSARMLDLRTPEISTCTMKALDDYIPNKKRTRQGRHEEQPNVLDLCASDDEADFLERNSNVGLSNEGLISKSICSKRSISPTTSSVHNAMDTVHDAFSYKPNLCSSKARFDNNNNRVFRSKAPPIQDFISNNFSDDLQVEHLDNFYAAKTAERLQKVDNWQKKCRILTHDYNCLNKKYVSLENEMANFIFWRSSTR